VYWGDWICGNKSLICDKIRGFVDICRENERKRRNGERKEGDYLSGHNLNITKGFTDGY